MFAGPISLGLSPSRCTGNSCADIGVENVNKSTPTILRTVKWGRYLIDNDNIMVGSIEDRTHLRFGLAAEAGSKRCYLVLPTANPLV